MSKTQKLKTKGPVIPVLYLSCGIRNLVVALSKAPRAPEVQSRWSSNVLERSGTSGRPLKPAHTVPAAPPSGGRGAHPYPTPSPWTHAEHSRDQAAQSLHSSPSHSWTQRPSQPGTGSGTWSWGTFSTGSILHSRHGLYGRSVPLAASAHSGSRGNCTAGSLTARGHFLQRRKDFRKPKAPSEITMKYIRGCSQQQEMG